jgi:LCP family protein required for cell wall assembly
MTDHKMNIPAVPAEGKGGAALPDAGTSGSGKAHRRRFPIWLRWALISLLVVLACIFGYAGVAYSNIHDFQVKIYAGTQPPLPTEYAGVIGATPEPARPTPRPGEPTWTPYPTTAPAPADAAEPTEVLPPGRINILVLGTDKRTELQEDAARSDTLIIISVDPQWKTAGILSVPRDLQVPVPGHGLQKINAAYFYGEYDKLPGGGPTLTVPTVQRFFRVPIQYYVSINFDGFEKVIDELGGIDLYVPQEIDDPQYPGPYNSYIHVHFDAGCQHMNGTQALEYARTRHADSDFGRALRQQQVIKAAREKALQLDMLFRYNDVLNQLGDAVETNIPPDLQWTFAQLAGQIQTSDVYTAQIDANMVREVADTGELQLRQDKAKPMLDWFFGRGAYARLKPGTVLTPIASPTALAAGPLHTGEPARSPVATPTLSGQLGVYDYPSLTPTAAGVRSSVGEAAPPDGKCP